MHCRHCANTLSENAVVCPKCGMAPRSGNAHCPDCGAVTKAGQVACLTCGGSLAGQGARKAGARDNAAGDALIHCRSCANQVSSKAIVCTSCGMDPRTGQDHCPSCGGATKAGQVACLSCGAGLKRTAGRGASGGPSISFGGGNYDESQGIRNLQDLISAIGTQVDGDHVPTKDDFISYAILPFRKYVKIDGRSCRKELLSFILLNIGIVFALFFLSIIPIVNILAWLLYFAYAVAILPATLCLYVRRWHDLNVTGWATIANFVPVLNVAASLVLMIVPGTTGDNDFGPDPRAR